MAESVTVGVRLRPLNTRELSSDNPSIAWCADADKSEISRMSSNSNASSNNTTGSFHFDNVFDATSTNETVYTELGSPVVDAALGGFNATIFAYGQTSSGKTHSMLGDISVDPGITPRAIRHVLDIARESRTRQFLIRAVYVEIYNDKIRDLLNPTAGDLAVREDAAGRTFVDACETVVNTFEDAMNVLEKGQAARHVGKTDMNAHSSRSHTVFSLLIESKPKINSTNTSSPKANNGEKSGKKKKSNNIDGGEQKSFRASSLNLVDLAGSERVKSTGATGKRQKEGCHINQSLLVLGTIINRLSAAAGDRSKVGHLPYRQSKLTRLLRPALGGNARTAILCAITPAAKHAEETLSTLKFAERAKKVTNHARRNEVVDYRAKYEQSATEVAVLRERLAAKEAELEEALKANLAANEKKLKEEKDEKEKLKQIVVEEGKEPPSPPSIVTSSASSSPGASLISTPSISASPSAPKLGETPSSSSSSSSSSSTTSTSTATSTSTSTSTSSSISSTASAFTSTSKSTIISKTISETPARKLHSDTDLAVKREVELRELRGRCEYLLAHAEEVESANESLRERLRLKAREFGHLRSRAVELRQLARTARSHERSLLRIVRVAFDALEEARGQLDASRKKGAHVLTAEAQLKVLSTRLCRYAKLGEEALRQDAKAKYERAVVLRKPGTVAKGKGNGTSGPGTTGASAGTGEGKEVEKAAAIALKLSGVRNETAASFTLMPTPRTQPQPQSQSQQTNSNKKNNHNTTSQLRNNRNNINNSNIDYLYTPSSTSSCSSATPNNINYNTTKRRPRPLPEDMVADIDESDDEENSTNNNNVQAAYRQKSIASTAATDWTEIDADLESDDGDDFLNDTQLSDGSSSSFYRRNGSGGSKNNKRDESDSGSGKKSKWSLRSFYGFGQHGVYDVMVGGHKVDGNSATGLAR